MTTYVVLLRCVVPEEITSTALTILLSSKLPADPADGMLVTDIQVIARIPQTPEEDEK